MIIDAICKQVAATDLPLSLKSALVAAAGTAVGAATGGGAGAATGFNATANNYLSTTDLRNKKQAVADCNGSRQLYRDRAAGEPGDQSCE